MDLTYESYQKFFFIRLPLIFLPNIYDTRDGYTPHGDSTGRTKTFPRLRTNVTIRFSKARHVRREPDEVRQQVEDRTDRKKRQGRPRPRDPR